MELTVSLAAGSSFMGVLAVREALMGRQGGLEEAFDGLEDSLASSIHTLPRSDCTLASARFDVCSREGEGYWEFLRLGPDLFAIVSNVLYSQAVTIPVVGEDWVEFHFRLSGELKLVEGEDCVDVSPDSLLIWRQPRGCDIIEYLNGDGKRETSVTFYCRPSFFERHFGGLASLLDDGLAETLGAQCDQLQLLRAVLYPALSRLIIDFASTSDRPGILLVKAESLAVQIISEVLLNVPLQGRVDASHTRLSDQDFKCLRAARQILLEQHAPPPTIEQLGRRIGMSGTKLKCGFRMLFGQTISQFANELRMSAAKEMLRKCDRPIAQVSAELGYEYQNSFTVAFRRRWGVLPKDYRRDPLAYDQSPTVAA
ncbi:MAG: helix-turn-helix transcriptional regulator [Sphingopyxis sp.]|nr:helix-turn-helix transcriptional regulator [Sphingopyxis sp.]